MDKIPYDLALECNLQIGMRWGVRQGTCRCAEYLVKRRSVLLPEVVEKAKIWNQDPIELFVRYVNRLHKTLCE